MRSDLLSRSELDEARWGVRSGRARLETIGELDEVEHRCCEEGIHFLVARVPTQNIDTVQEMERRGFFLTDTLLWFRRDLVNKPLPALTRRETIVSGGPEDAEEVYRVAQAAFKGYSGHYHADPRIEPDQADEIYADWARRGCLDSRMGVGNGVLIARLDGKIVGFGLVVLRNEREGDGRLYGVHPCARGRGIYRDLVVAVMRWTKDQGRQLILESTQVTNVASQKVWCQLGFEPYRSEYTLHRWFS